MRRSLALTLKFAGFSECNSRGTWDKECAVFPGVCDFPVLVSLLHRNTTSRWPETASVDLTSTERLLLS